MSDTPLLVVEIDPRIKQLSYSSTLTLHACPRKFQLYKLQSSEAAGLTDNQSGLTFAYGHMVGEGIQMVLEGKDERSILFTLFCKWEVDLFEENEKQQKSFWLGIHAVQKFIGLRKAGLLDDWELVYVDGNPAIELSFVINFPDGFRYRGYFDAVLRHRITGKVAVLECKTSSLNEIDDAVFKNSAQAIGYSIVLDAIFPDLTAYEVFYLIYKTKVREYDLRAYTKSYMQRAVWIQELLLDIETIKLYEGAGVYPMHGESCYEYYRQCEYFNLCTLSTEHLVKQLDQKSLDKIAAEKYTVNLSLTDLLDSQLSKS